MMDQDENTAEGGAQALLRQKQRQQDGEGQV